MSNAQTTSCTSECAEPLYCAWTEWSLPWCGVIAVVLCHTLPCAHLLSPRVGLALRWACFFECNVLQGLVPLRVQSAVVSPDRIARLTAKAELVILETPNPRPCHHYAEQGIGHDPL